MIEIQISVFFLHLKKLKYFLVEFTAFEICSTEQKAFCFFLQLSFLLSQQFVGEGGIYKEMFNNMHVNRFLLEFESLLT